MMKMRHVFRNPAEVLVIRIPEDVMYDPRALRRVGFHLFIFLRRKAAGLAKDLIVDGDFPQVMHRRRLDQIFAEGIRQLEFSAFPDRIHQDPDSFAGPADMSAGGIVPTFHHRGQTEDQAVVHPDDFLRLGCHFRLQIAVVLIHQADIFLILRVVFQKDLIPAHPMAVVQVADGSRIDALFRLAGNGKMKPVLSFFSQIAFQPALHRIPKRFRIRDRAVNGQLIQLRQNAPRRLIAAQISSVGIQCNKPRFAGLHHGLDHHLADIVIGHATCDQEIDDLGQRIDQRHGFVSRPLQEKIEEIAQHGSQRRNKEQQQNPAGDLFLFPIAVNDRGGVSSQIQNDAEIVYRMERSVNLLLHPGAADLLDRHAPVKQRRIADRQHGKVHGRTQQQSADPDRFPNVDPAELKLAHRDQPGQKASADIDDFQKSGDRIRISAGIHEHIAQIDDGDQQKYGRHMDFKLLFPADNIQKHQQERKAEQPRII